MEGVSFNFQKKFIMNTIINILKGLDKDTLNTVLIVLGALFELLARFVPTNYPSPLNASLNILRAIIVMIQNMLNKLQKDNKKGGGTHE